MEEWEMNLMILAIISYLVIGCGLAYLIDIRIRMDTGCKLFGIKGYAITALGWPAYLLFVSLLVISDVVRTVIKPGDGK